MSVVTIRGQLGSGAPEIGKLVADMLNIDYVDREIIANVAELLKAHEQDVITKEMPPGSIRGRIAEALAHYYPSDVDYAAPWETPLDDTRYLEALRSIVLDLTRSGSIVIRGRGSQFILKNYPGAIHVLIVSPLKLRLNYVIGSLKLDKEAAKQEIARFDGSRREFIKRYFKADLEDSLHYDLVINTGRFSFEAAASIIVDSTQLKN